VRREDPKPETHRRVFDAVEDSLGRSHAFTEWQLARQDGSVEQLVKQAGEVRLRRT
jgi:hypothetical protein